MLIAGKGARKEDFLGYEKFINQRIFYVGHLNWDSLVSLYKRSSTFIHLAYLDHCPNVVVDAAAAGCEIVCASSGGTREIKSKNMVIVGDEKWDFSPIDLYNPPSLNFESKILKKDKSFDYSIDNAAESYFSIMNKLI